MADYFVAFHPSKCLPANSGEYAPFRVEQDDRVFANRIGKQLKPF
jgi:hypothetical protein